MRRILIVSLAWLAWPHAAVAQDLEPRRWAHMPVGTNVGGITYAYAEGDLALDPVLQLENAEVETHQVLATYVRSFDFFGKTGRLDLIVPWATSRWEGRLSGAPVSTRRHGLADPWLRLSVNLRGYHR